MAITNHICQPITPPVILDLVYQTGYLMQLGIHGITRQVVTGAFVSLDLKSLLMLQQRIYPDAS
jgi:uncharacterized protein (DUF2062 family)